jgi:hypothetical protein
VTLYRTYLKNTSRQEHRSSSHYRNTETTECTAVSIVMKNLHDLQSCRISIKPLDCWQMLVASERIGWHNWHQWHVYWFATSFLEILREGNFFSVVRHLVLWCIYHNLLYHKIVFKGAGRSLGSKRTQGCPLVAAGHDALLKMPSRSTIVRFYGCALPPHVVSRLVWQLELKWWPTVAFGWNCLKWNKFLSGVWIFEILHGKG